MLTWPIKDPKMIHSPLISIQGGKITLIFLGVMDLMPWVLTPKLECFLQTTPSLSLILPTPVRGHIFRASLMHLDHYLLLLKCNLLLVTLTLTKLRGDLIIWKK